MNNTAIFSSGQKAALPIVLVPCALLFFIIHRYAKRRLNDNETLDRRMEYFNVAFSAALLGHLIFKMQPSIPQPYAIAVGIGFFIMLSIERLSESWRDDIYMSADAYSKEIYHCVDRSTTQIKCDLIESNLQDPDLPVYEKIHTMEMNNLYARRRIAVIFIITMVCGCIIDGFLLKRGQTVTVVMFYISKLVQTFALAVSFVHAFYHNPEEGTWPWYLIFAIIWSITCACSAVPAMVNFAGPAGTDTALLIFYALTSGVIMWIALYFLFIDPTETNIKRIIRKLAVFLVIFVITYATSFFV